MNGLEVSPQERKVKGLVSLWTGFLFSVSWSLMTLPIPIQVTCKVMLLTTEDCVWMNQGQVITKANLLHGVGRSKWCMSYDSEVCCWIRPRWKSWLCDFTKGLGARCFFSLSFFIYKIRMRSASQGSYEDYQGATCYTRDGIRSLFTRALLPWGTLSPSVLNVPVSLPTPPCSAAEDGICSASMPHLSARHLLSGAIDQESWPGRAVCPVISFI